MANRNVVGPKNGWQIMGEEIPDDLIKDAENKIFEYPCTWFNNGSYKKDDKFIIVTDNGGMYKVGAEFMVWFNISGTVCAQAIWSVKALRKTLNSLMLEGKTTFDPDYQT